MDTESDGDANEGDSEIADVQRGPGSGAMGAAGSEEHPRDGEDASGSGLARAGPEASGGGSANAGHGWRGRRQRHSPYYCGEVAGCGTILINTHGSATSLDAQCSRCLRRINRKYRPHASRGEAHQQGRPMGSLISWLQLTCNGDYNAHWLAYTPDKLPFEARLAARRWGVASGALTACFAKERHPIDFEGEEPERLA